MRRVLSILVVLVVGGIIVFLILPRFRDSEVKGILSTCEYLLEERSSLLGTSTDITSDQIYGGRVASLRIDDTFPQATEFRSALSQALEGGVNFAGRYTVATWGCGTSCQRHAVIDTATGRVVAFGLESELGISHTPRSKVLILNPKESFPKPGETNMSYIEEVLTWSRIPREYYILVEDGREAHLEKFCTENPYDASFK
jgi:hypothetical protein